MADPVDFVVKKLPYDLSSHGGLALVGRLFKRINLPALVDPKYPVQAKRGGIANSDILTCDLVSRIAVMEPGMFGVMEPVSGC
jgi:hypothetical protein